MDVFNAIMKSLSNILKSVVLLLPDSPFKVLDNSVVAEYLPLLNWFFPFDFIISTMSVWLSAIVVYYVYSAILRWVKAVQ